MRYKLNKPGDNAPGHKIMNFGGYESQYISSCDTRNVCGQKHDLKENPKGVLWCVKPMSYWTNDITMNPSQVIYWGDYNINDGHHVWKLEENQYAGPAQTDFSYDTSLLTELNPKEGMGQRISGSYFKAVKAGESVFKATISRPYYDTFSENNTYGRSVKMENFWQEIKIKIVNDPILIDQMASTEELCSR